MYVYYYDHPGTGPVIVCCRGAAPGRLSPVWSQTNASVLMIEHPDHEDDQDAD
jgi:hypothetical protein